MLVCAALAALMLTLIQMEWASIYWTEAARVGFYPAFLCNNDITGWITLPRHSEKGQHALVFCKQGESERCLVMPVRVGKAVVNASSKHDDLGVHPVTNYPVDREACPLKVSLLEHRTLNKGMLITGKQTEPIFILASARRLADSLNFWSNGYHEPPLIRYDIRFGIEQNQENINVRSGQLASIL
ncbi:MAG TPA: hypothetical protein VMF67_07860 [Rhizomicrobium sp.]|nr:hypothetical protein [Rhizomicrobium sp.]